MRRYPETKEDNDHAAELNAEPWMLETLKLNPGYINWGPYEDYMIDKDAGWRSPVFLKTFGEMFALNELNEVVNFYFAVRRESKDCTHCDSSGYNPETKSIADDWYDFAKTGRRWCERLGQIEVDALWDAGRLQHDFKEKPTPAEVNSWASSRALGHDAINRILCVEARARGAGVYGHCEHCNGNGYQYTEPSAKLSLTLWVIHPRKGASRGVEIAEITQEDLPKAFALLREASDRSAERFARIPSTAPQKVATP